MANERMTFTLVGRDNLSREFNRAGASAAELQRDIERASAQSRASLAGLQRDANGRLRDVRGRFVSTAGAARMLADAADGSFERVSQGADRASVSLRKLKFAAIGVGVAAAVPAAAAGAEALLSLASAAAAATAGVVSFGLAVAPQIVKISDAAQAQTKLSEAIAASGAGSSEAAEAQVALTRELEALDPATRDAAEGFMALRSEYKDWSASVAGDTMPVLTHSFATFGDLLPRLTPLVRGTATELDRLLAVLAGMQQQSGFGTFLAQVEELSSSALHRMTTGLANLSTTLASMDTSMWNRFMALAAEHGPLVAESLSNVAQALANILLASGGVGAAVLQLANTLAQMVNALPPEFLTTVIQVYAAFKLWGGLTALIDGLSARLVTLRASATAAGGAMATLRARMAAMSAGGVAGLAVAGAAAVAYAINELAENARGAPADVDRLTTSIKRLAATGKFGGELAAAFGDLDGLGESLQRLTVDAKGFAAIQGTFGSTLTESTRKFHDLVDSFVRGEESAQATREDFAALDKSMAGLVKGGNADAAAELFKRIKAEARSQNVAIEDVNKALPKYRDALAAAKVAQELAAEGMGIFGQKAIETSAKLEDQAAAANGLRMAITDLNDANRAAYDSQIAFEQGIDALTAAFKENGATLDINTEAGQKNGTAMSRAAAAHDEMMAAGIAAGESLASMTGKSERLRTKMFDLAAATNMSDKEAREYVNTLLGTPGDIKTMVKLERKDAISGLRNVQREIEKTPGKKEVKVDTLNAAAIAALEDVGLKTRRLPDGRTAVYTKNGQSLGAIGSVRQALNNLDGKTASTFVKTYYTSIYRSIRDDQSFTLGNAPGSSQGGPIRGYATGGAVAGGFVSGPGTSTSDSIPAMLSDGEYVIRAAMVKRYGESFFSMLNQGALPLDRPTAGSSGLFERGGRNVGREVADGLRDALPVVRDAARRLGKEFAGQAGRSGFDRAVSELNRLVDSGRWNNKGSLLFEDISFQGMSGNFGRHQDRVADGFWAAVREIKKAVSSGRRVHEDMTFRGMSKNVLRFHDAIAQIWKGNPYGRNFGDWGRFGRYGQYGKYATGGHVTGAGTGTSDSILARVSNGEYVVRAAAVRRYGTAVLDDINQMRALARTTSAGGATSPPAQTNTTTFNVYPQRADFSVHDLEALQRRVDVRARVGRPR